MNYQDKMERWSFDFTKDLIDFYHEGLSRHVSQETLDMVNSKVCDRLKEKYDKKE